jgi:hydrogenase expression/formation protein HypC
MCLGIPGKVAETFTQNELPMAKVEFGGIRKDVCLSYVPEAAVGDYVIVHVGFAISRVDEEEAEEIFDYLRAIGEASDEEASMSNGGISDPKSEIGSI